MVHANLRSPLVLPLVLAGAALLAACGDAAPSPPSGAEIRLFDVTPRHLEEAGDVTVSWATAGAASFELRRGEDPIEADPQEIDGGSIVVGVTETTTFTLTVRDAGGDRRAPPPR